MPLYLTRKRQMRDIYTKKEIVTPSSEHVLLSSLGGRLESNELLDQTTNSSFGDTIDAALNQLIQLPRLVCDAKSARGYPASILKGVVGDDGQNYDLHPGGIPQIGKSSASFSKQPDGAIIVHAKVRSLKEAQQMLGRKLRQLGVDAKALILKHQRKESVEVPRLAVPIAFGRPHYRAITKMVCNLFAIAHHDIFLEHQFDHIRSFVLNGSGEPNSFIWLNSRPIIPLGVSNLGLVDHLLIVHISKNGNVTGLCALFGFLQFIIQLGQKPIIPKNIYSYRVDQIGQANRQNHPDDLSIGPSLLDNREFAGRSRESELFHESLASLERFLAGFN